MAVFRTPWDIMNERNEQLIRDLRLRKQNEVDAPIEDLKNRLIEAETRWIAFMNSNSKFRDWWRKNSSLYYQNGTFPFPDLQSQFNEIHSAVESARLILSRTEERLRPVDNDIRTKLAAIINDPELIKARRQHDYIVRWRYDPMPLLEGVLGGFGDGRNFIKYFELLREERRPLSAFASRYYTFAKRALDLINDPNASPLTRFNFLMDEWDVETKNPNFPHLRRLILEGADPIIEVRSVIDIGRAIEERRALEQQIAQQQEQARLAALQQPLPVPSVMPADPAGSIIVATPPAPVVQPAVMPPSPVPQIEQQPVAPPPPPVTSQPAVQQTIQQAAAAIEQQPKAADGLTQADLQVAIAQAVAAAQPTQQGVTPEQVQAAIAQAVAAVKAEAESARRDNKPELTIDDIKSVVASAVGRSAEKSAAEVAATPTIAQVVAADGNWFTQRTAGLPNWALIAVGLVVLASIGGGIWYATKGD